MKKIRRMILVDGTYKYISLWEVLCKWGTHSGTIAYLFDEPKEGVRTTAIKSDSPAALAHARQFSVRVTEVRESDGFVFLEMF